jgi:hypothetical protein
MYTDIDRYYAKNMYINHRDLLLFRFCLLFLVNSYYQISIQENTWIVQIPTCL